MVEEIEKKFQRVRNWFNGEPSGPFKLKLLLSYRCNLECRFCRWGSPVGSGESGKSLHTWDKRRPDKEISVDKWLDIIEEASDIGCEKVDIIGGEPFIRSNDIGSVLRKVKEEGMYGQVTTNGTLLDSELAREIVDMGWDRILVSIDSPRAEVHDAFRGVKGTFKKAIDGIKNLREWKEKLNKNEPKITLTCILAKWSVNELEEMVELADFCGVDRFNLTPLFADFEKIENYKIDRENSKIVDKLKRLEKLADRKGLDNNFRDVYENEIIMTESDKYDTLKEEMSEDEDGEEPQMEDSEEEMDEEDENEVTGDDSGECESNEHEENGCIRREDKKIDEGRYGKKEETEERLPLCFDPWTVLRVDAQGWVTFCQSQEDGEKYINIRDKSVDEVWFSDFFDQARERIKRREEFDKCENCCFNVYSDNMSLLDRFGEGLR